VTNAAVDNLRAGEWDGEGWREARDTQLLQWVGDPEAVRFCLSVSQFCEVFDDFVDADVVVQKNDMVRAVFNAMYHIPANHFFNAHRSTLLPVMFLFVNAWLDSNELAQGDTSDKALAYTLKGLGVEVLLTCIGITRGVDYLRTVSVDIRRTFMAHQSFADYCKETADVV
jgi:hypothetical protein